MKLEDMGDPYLGERFFLWQECWTERAYHMMLHAKPVRGDRQWNFIKKYVEDFFSHFESKQDDICFDPIIEMPEFIGLVKVCEEQGMHFDGDEIIDLYLKHCRFADQLVDFKYFEDIYPEAYDKRSEEYRSFMKKNIKNWNDDKEIEQYLSDLLNKKAFDKSGLIYGMGHAVYSLSDPRANVFKSFVESLSKEKGREDEFNLYSRVERLAPQVIASERKMYKGVSANVDFYSGFVYSMLDLPMELYTPMFAIARIAGWSAHRIEELVNPGKIIRPAYKSIAAHKEYVPLDSRD